MYDYLDEIRYSPKKNESVFNKAEKLLRKRKVAFAIILSGVILGGLVANSIISDRRAKKEILNKFELIEGVALDNVKNYSRVIGATRYGSGWVYLDRTNDLYPFTDRVISDSSVDVDLNGDGVRDVTLHISVKTPYKKLSKEQLYAMTNIKKGSKLLLEGVVDRDENGKPVNVRFPNNGVSIDPEDKHEMVDKERGRDYIDMQNLVRVDGCQFHIPLNKSNSIEETDNSSLTVKMLKLSNAQSR